MACRPGSVLYVVDLGGGSVYVGSTSQSPRARLKKHREGGRTSVKSVRRRGKRLRPDLSRGAKSESGLIAKLKRAGYKVEGSPREFCGPSRGRKAKR